MNKNIPNKPSPTKIWDRYAPARTRSVMRRSGSNGDLTRASIRKNRTNSAAPPAMYGQQLVEPQPLVEAWDTP